GRRPSPAKTATAASGWSNASLASSSSAMCLLAKGRDQRPWRHHCVECREAGVQPDRVAAATNLTSKQRGLAEQALDQIDGDQCGLVADVQDRIELDDVQ